MTYATSTATTMGTSPGAAIAWLDQAEWAGPSGTVADSPLGAKAANLARLTQAGFAVPLGFVVLPPAVPLGEPTLGMMHLEAIHAALRRLCPEGEPVAVRSSAQGEDGDRHAFAGQWLSVLGVLPVDVPTQIMAVWRSGEGVASYREQQGLMGPVSLPAVLVQRLVPATVAGVAFGADPLTGRRGVTVINAGYGLAQYLVAGDWPGDRYGVNREGGILERAIAAKPKALVWTGERGLQEQAIAPPLQRQSALSDSDIQAVAALSRHLTQTLGQPQDSEWAFDQGQLYLLQARPITTLATLADPDGAYGLWDNSNIIESYSGVTTPLTFSFARTAYTEVYRQFCRFMGVPQPLIERHSGVFGRMIGFLQGRIYYNLLSWYRILTLLPGYRLNARFLEQMLGLQQALPEAIASQLQREVRTHPLVDAGRLVQTSLRMIWNYATLPWCIRAYQRRLEQVLLSPADLKRLPEARPDELVEIYRRVEQELLCHWDAPLINDFFAMMSYGLLRGMVKRWCGDGQGTLHHDLISLSGDVISTEPAWRLREMARVVRERAGLSTVLAEGSRGAVERAIAADPELQGLYQEYLERFGDRCLEELKLESPTLADDPLPLLRTVGCLAQADLAQADAASKLSKDEPGGPQCRGEGSGASLAVMNQRLALQQVAGALRGHPLRRWGFGWTLETTRRLVRNRENLRFERTRVFGQARRIFMELGKRFYGLRLLERAEDVVFLEVGEIIGVVEGTAACKDLAGLAAVRRRAYERDRLRLSPPRRFETRGIPDWGLSLAAPVESGPPSQALDRWQGCGCSPGRVRGRVSVVGQPREWLQRQSQNPERSRSSRILVATSTDPGWILLFPHAQGLLVERGSVLSHVAIVSRELGLPMVTELAELTMQLREGDWVEMDGHTGMVWRLAGGEGLEGEAIAKREGC